VIAKITHYPADGFSLPYQLAIGLASLFYLFLGLFYLRKLLQKLFKDDLAATIAPIFIFYGTYLYYYGINLNSQSHVYSFTFITLFMYFAFSFCKEDNNKLTNFLLSALCLAIVVCIRPLNGLVLFVTPLFFTKTTFKNIFKFQELKLAHLAIALLTVAVLYHQLNIMYIQTGTFLPYTYTDEHFDFSNPRLFDVLISYHSGWFVYVPLAFISFFGALFLPTLKQKIVLPLFYAGIIFLYSCWWYWPITARAVIDYHALLAIFLAAFLIKVRAYKKIHVAFITLLCICVMYYQLKSIQLNRGILAENYTYKEVFWRNFFRLHKANMYLIPPESIIQQEIYLQDNETQFSEGAKNTSEKYSGNTSILLDKTSPFGGSGDIAYPSLFNQKGIRKIRLSFWCNFKGDVTGAQIYLKLLDKDRKVVFETPFYINPDYINKNTWDYKEFGYQVGDEDLAGKNPVACINWFIWNSETKGQIFIDDLKTEFILTNTKFETLK
jgi:hypothetical protein